MSASGTEDGKLSDKMEGDENVRTVESLRGRLLAERQASRVAKENAELMGNKLIELENQLREETKLRNIAEKKLKFLTKKLESLKFFPILEESEQSSSSVESAFSCRSFTSTSGPKHPEEAEPKSQITNPEISQNPDQSVSEATATTPSNQSHYSPSIEENTSSPGTANSNTNSTLKDPFLEIPRDKSSPSSENSKTEDQSSSSLKASMAEMERDGRNERDSDEDSVDNSLALVPVSLPEKSQSSELMIVNRNVGEVLDALRHAREKIQSSLERRRMIRVGPA